MDTGLNSGELRNGAHGAPPKCACPKFFIIITSNQNTYKLCDIHIHGFPAGSFFAEAGSFVLRGGQKLRETRKKKNHRSSSIWEFSAKRQKYGRHVGTLVCKTCDHQTHAFDSCSRVHLTEGRLGPRCSSRGDLCYSRSHRRSASSSVAEFAAATILLVVVHLAK